VDRCVSILADGQDSMSTRVRKHVGAHSARRDTSLWRDVQEAIDRIWPDGFVEMTLDPDESYFIELHPKLSRALRRIRNTRLVYEREADGGPVWWEESDPEEDPPDEIERSRSYHTFFVSPDGEGFTFETEAEGITEPDFMTDDFAEAGWGEEPPVSRISGSGRTGWVVAVSLLAPFAVIELGDMVTFEGYVAKTVGWRLIPWSGANHPVSAIQMAPLSRRGDLALRPLVFTLSNFLPAHVGNDARAGFGNRSQLYLAMGPGVWAGIGKAMSTAFEAHQ
jgi:hypothetical protein